MPLRNTPSPQGKKHRKHNRKFFGKQRHGHSDPYEDPTQPAAARKTVDNRHTTAYRKPEPSHDSDDALCFFLKMTYLWFNRLQSFPHPPQLRSRSSLQDFCYAVTLHDKSSGINKREVISAWPDHA